MNKKVAIIGNGWVGQGMQELFPDAVVYTRSLRTSDYTNTVGKFTSDKEVINKADVAFICVPTPNAHEAINSSEMRKILVKIQLVRSFIGNKRRRQARHLNS
jgi:3-hydroxyisobutyrate dehydrogenase-like beta-hydroxyacid dehydrogenase